MKSFKSFRLLVLGVVSVTAIPAYADTSIANPASVQCATLKGQLKILTAPAGEVGICTFGKAAVEEWTLFHRFQGGKLPKAIALYGSHPDFQNAAPSRDVLIANPAAVYCAQLGGHSVKLMDGKAKS